MLFQKYAALNGLRLGPRYSGTRIVLCLPVLINCQVFETFDTHAIAMIGRAISEKARNAEFIPLCTL